MKIGDRIKMKKRSFLDNRGYQIGTVVSITGQSLEIKVDGIDGSFIFSKDIVTEVINECD